MSEFDRYLECLRARADLVLSPEAERTLHMPFHLAVAAQLALGRPTCEAELAALGELGSLGAGALLHAKRAGRPHRRLRWSRPSRTSVERPAFADLIECSHPPGSVT